MNLKTVVVYYRVSTKRQGESGLGLKGQQTAVHRLLAYHSDSEVIAEFTEVESGRKTKRQQFNRAVDLCKQTGATLIVAKLDRLARSVLVTSTLMRSGVDFVACDMPEATRLTIHIMAAIAEDEAERIAERTRAGLAQTDKPLGSARPGHWDQIKDRCCWAGMPVERKQEIKSEKLHDSFGAALPLIRALRQRGETFERIAQELNSHGYRTPRGRKFRRQTIHEVMRRHQEVSPQAAPQAGLTPV